MKVLICGGRKYTLPKHDTDLSQRRAARELAMLDNVLTQIHEDVGFTLVIDGAASGADSAAHRWAVEHKIETRRFPADWKKYGKAAGALRNQQMLDEGKPDMVIAFPGGAGTADMFDRAQRAGVARVVAVVVNPCGCAGALIPNDRSVTYAQMQAESVSEAVQHARMH